MWPIIRARLLSAGKLHVCCLPCRTVNCRDAANGIVSKQWHKNYYSLRWKSFGRQKSNRMWRKESARAFTSAARNKLAPAISHLELHNCRANCKESAEFTDGVVAWSEKIAKQTEEIWSGRQGGKCNNWFVLCGKWMACDAFYLHTSANDFNGKSLWN